MKRREAIFKLTVFGSTFLISFGLVKTYLLFKVSIHDVENIDKNLVDELAETIIPQTSSPGAIQAGVGPFIIGMLRDCTTRPTLNRFMSGLHDLQEYSHRQYSHDFVACTLQQKETILTHFEKKGQPLKGIAGKVERRLIGDSFFVTLKKYTVLGYCTSKPGATEGLAYDYVPGGYVNTKLQPGQKAWAIQ